MAPTIMKTNSIVGVTDLFPFSFRPSIWGAPTTIERVACNSAEGWMFHTVLVYRPVSRHQPLRLSPERLRACQLWQP
jgi:hypothetical protein